MEQDKRPEFVKAEDGHSCDVCGAPATVYDMSKYANGPQAEREGIPAFYCADDASALDVEAFEQIED